MNNKKTILIVTGIYPPDIGGPASYVRILEEELPKFDFNVKVVTFADEDNYPKDNNITRINRKDNIILKYTRYFIEVLSQSHKADIIYAMGPVASGLPTMIAAKLRNKKYYLKVVGDYAWERGRLKAGIKDSIGDFQNKTYDFLTEIIRKIEHIVARNAVKVITPSEYLKKIVSGWGVEQNDIQVIYNAVKKAQINESKEVLRKKLNLEGKIIISSGRLVPWKGFVELVELWPELISRDNSFKLVIVGEGPMKTNIINKINELHLQDNIILTGSLSQIDLWRYIKASDLFILNTAYEGLSHLLVEALSLGVPVAASRAGGNVEVILEKKNGILFQYNQGQEIKNIILRVLEGDYTLDNNIGLERFDRNNMIKNLVKLLK